MRKLAGLIFHVTISENLSMSTRIFVFAIQELVVNSVCISGNAEYIVAGTDNNLVCIWKKIT